MRRVNQRHPSQSGASRPAGALLLLSLGLWAGLVLGAGPASASRLAIVARGIGPGSDKATALVGHFTSAAFASDDRYEVINTAVALGNPRRDQALRQFQIAEDLMQKARQNYEGLDLDAAEKSLKSALSRYERWAPYLGDLKKLSDALMLLGAVYILKGDERRGSSALEQAISIFPGAEPDPRVFNPAMRVQFGQAGARLAAEATGTLFIATSPSYASVFVDGRFAGVSPLPVDGLPPGRHIVRVERPGYLPWGKPVEVASHAESHESAPLRPTAHLEQFDAKADRAVQALDAEKDDERAVSLRALTELLESDTVFFVRVRLDGERVRIEGDLFDPKADKKERRGEHVFAYDTRTETYEREVQIFLREAFGLGDAPQGKKKNPTDAGVDKPAEAEGKTLVHAGGRRGCGMVSCPTMKKIITGSLIGAGGVFGAVGGVQWALARKDHTVWRKTPQTASNQVGLRNKGYSAALTGDILVPLGVASILAGALVATLWHPAISAEDVADRLPVTPTRKGRSVHSDGLSFQFDASPGGASLGGTWQF